MIVVLADDLTGAAELGGIGLRYDLTVEIAMDVNVLSRADLMIVCADTRSMSEHEAIDATINICKKLAELKPEVVFKKIDSVLRGHILAEIKIQTKILGFNKALIVPANPSLGRTIENGIYHLNGKPIHLSSFSQDPEFPIKTSKVTDMLRPDDNDNVQLISIADPVIPADCIAIGEVSRTEELNIWASAMDSQTLAVGGAGFFLSVLQSLHLPGRQKNREEAAVFSNPQLFVSGTTFGKSVIEIKNIQQNGGPVSYMPHEIASSENPSSELFEVWGNQIVQLLQGKCKAIIAIDRNVVEMGVPTALGLRNKTAKVVEYVFAQLSVRELFIEGGSTACAILKQLGYTRFTPVQELAPGTIRMQTDQNNELHVTIKPGSYDWPGDIFHF